MNWQLLQKYILGKTKDEEIEKVEKWRKADPQNQQLLELIEKIWKIKPKDRFEIDKNSAWKQFKQNIDTYSGRDLSDVDYKSDHKLPNRKNRKKRSIYYIAASIILLIAVFIYQDIVTIESGSSTVKRQVINTKSGQQVSFELGDGSKVLLNSDSRLEISKEFNDGIREVYLDGQAYFEVESDKQHPFIVYSGNNYTQVLGTKFGVRAYSDENTYQAVVEEGKVKVHFQENKNRSHEFELEKNQIGKFDGNGIVQVQSLSDTNAYIGWKDGKLIYESTSFEKVIKELNRRYNINIVLADSSLNSRTITTSFDNDPLTEVLNVLALSINANYERDGRNFTFYKNE